MDILSTLPECKIFYIQAMLATHNARYCMLEGESDGGRGELAFVLPIRGSGTWPVPTASGPLRGFATLDNAGKFTIEWVATPRSASRAFASALKRLGWKSSIHADFVYGRAS